MAGTAKWREEQVCQASAAEHTKVPVLHTPEFKVPRPSPEASAFLQGPLQNFRIILLLLELVGKKLGTIFRRPRPWKPALQQEMSVSLQLQSRQPLEGQLLFLKRQALKCRRSYQKTLPKV